MQLPSLPRRWRGRVLILSGLLGVVLVILALAREHTIEDGMLLAGVAALMGTGITLARARGAHQRTKLLVSEHRYRTLARNLPGMGVILFDQRLVTLAVEGEAFLTAGLDPAALEGRPIADALSSDASTAYLPLYAAAIAGRAGRVERTAGNGRAYVVHAFPVRTLDDQPAGMAVIQDVTDRRRLEAQFVQAQKMEGIGRLAGGIAHDFNNLLTAIQGMSELVLLDLPAGAQIHADVSEILAVARRGVTLTRQLLSFARQQIIQPRRVWVGQLLLESAPLLRRILTEAVDLHLALADVPVVIADPAQLEQVLVNLAVNAKDAMPSGGTVTIRTQLLTLDTSPASDLLPGQWVSIQVQDTGVGMPPEVLNRVCEPFFTTKPVGQGTGLGLATCYGIMQQHGGAIRITSAPGRGTTVELLLPPASRSPLPDRSDPTATDAGGGAPQLIQGQGRILLVEDDPAVRRFAHRALVAAGYSVETAEHGQAALAALASLSTPIDLVLSDVVMPQMSGPQLATIVQARYPGVRVVLMSGYTDNTITHAGVVDQGVTFLQKPFTAAGLTARVAAIMGAS